MNLQGAVAIVTGGTGALGRAIAHKLAQGGASVAIVYQQSADVAATVAAELEACGVEALPVQADVSCEADVTRMVAAVQAHFGHIDVLVNDAALNMWVSMTDLDSLTPDMWQKILGVNLTGPYLCIRAVAGIMQAQGRGRIVNITSVAGLEPTGSSIAYAVSKAGLIHLTKCMAVALAPHVLVNSVAPGFMEDTRTSSRLDPAHIQKVTEKSLIKTAVSKDDVADQVVTLVRSDSTTGQTVCLCGGRFFH